VFFETLKSGHNDGLVQRLGKAQERRFYIDNKTKTQREKSSKGTVRLREDRPVEYG